MKHDQKKSKIQVTHLLNELMPVNKVIRGLTVIYPSSSLRYRLSHTRRTRQWCTCTRGEKISCSNWGVGTN